MTVRFKGFDLYNTDELGDLVANSGKQINLRALPNPMGAGRIVVVLDGAFGFTNENAEGVLGVLREAEQTVPTVFLTSGETIAYMTGIQKLYVSINIAV
ncbi:hypothetical protein [Burkholderia contaminans]|uniref:hypothetical protein n=1 Tax=Burkholderia contaminans TaxID=488447 RepID=UPI000F564340|nr:hypothetical protein [Burkholderia contaminans]RQS88756.1 hypothetical protein DF035_36975 [Burkholderia contaminans]